jgi:hypothetical protein
MDVKITSTLDPDTVAVALPVITNQLMLLFIKECLTVEHTDSTKCPPVWDVNKEASLTGAVLTS